MKHCHECDSDIADNDIFCPYCGISIAGVAVQGASGDEEAFSSTIVIPSPVEPPAAVATEPAPFAKEAAPSLVTVENITEEQVEIPGEAENNASITERSAEMPEIALTDESINIETAPDLEISSEISEQDTLDYTDSLSGSLSGDFEVKTVDENKVSDEPRLAERLTGSIGSISGRFSSSAEESAASDEQESYDEADPVYVGSIEEVEHVAGADSPSEEANEPVISMTEEADETVAEVPEMSEPAELSVDERGPAARSQEVEFTIDSAPTPMLLSNAAADDDIVKTDDAEIVSAGLDVDSPADTEPSHESEAQQEIAVSSTAGDELIDGFDAVAEADKPFIESSEPADEFEEPTAVDEGPETPLSQLPESEELSEPVVPVTDESLVHNVADTGDGLDAVETDGGTSPNIGSGGTDGRKSGLKPLVEGTVLNNRYDIVRKIGGGGMGAVYLAFDRNLGGVQRAVKEMVQAHIEEEQQEKAIDDFKRESMILSTLDHPSIPTIYDYFFDAAESRFYLVMKYISGGDLAGRLRSTPEGRIDERTVTEWALQIIDVLDYLHNLPTTIVYRDLKPSNVMIDGNTGRIMLIDFGIARSINQNQEKGVTAVGTMGYAPPELFSGNVEPRSDIYSLGSTMFHLLTGADPQNNPLLIFDFQKNPRPRQINPQLSDQIERILMRAVEYNADARFASAAEMKAALAAHLDNLRGGQITYGVTEVPQSVSLSHQIVFCGFCGQRIVATDMFCAFCGSKQPLAQHGVHSEVYSRSVGTARLVIEGTSELNAPAYGLEKNENLVGRRDPMSNIFPEVDLSKYDPQTKISRRHAKIWRDGGSYLLEDLGSSNGTILLTNVSDTLRLLPHQPHPLASGDRIRIGDTTLHFIIG